MYFKTPLDVTPATELAWVTADVSAFVDDDADGVILFIVSTKDRTRDYGVREVGSSFSTTNRELERRSSTLHVVGIDGNDQFEVYNEKFNEVKFYLVGQTKGSVVYYSDDLAVSDPVTGSFQEIDADTYSVPAVANGLILRIENSDTRVMTE